MSSKMQFQVFYGEYNVMYGPNGVDLSAFKRTSSGIDKPLKGVLVPYVSGCSVGSMLIR